MGGDMTRKSRAGEDYEKLGGEDCILAVGYFSSFGEFGFGVLVNHCRGHRVAGGFGLGGQESSQNPGARETDRLLLADREENSVLGTISSWTQFQLGLGQIELGNKSLDKYFYSLLWHVHDRMMFQYVIYVIFLIQYIIYIMLPKGNFAES
jgi:hypothetical protein